MTTESEVIANSKLEHLYSHQFEDKRFFQVIFADQEQTEIKLAPRTLMKIIYHPDRDDIEGIEIVKQVNQDSTERLKFSKFNMQQLKAFLSFISTIDLKTISDRRIVLADNSIDILDIETTKKIRTLLSGSEGQDVIKAILDDGLITSEDIVNTGYRKKELETFRMLLEENYIGKYKLLYCKSNTKDEVAWQHFFNRNSWIFGYGLQYRFEGVLQREFNASDTNASGSNGVISDFLMGDNNFTTFVELKLPTTPLFGVQQNRSNCWKLSNHLTEAVSQILEQKASGQLKIETTKELFDKDNNLIHQRAYDSKAILIIGSWAELNGHEGVNSIKRKTFELFRRDSRNIDIITYDELYERAKFIVK
jgi:hypothetical protein